MQVDQRTTVTLRIISTEKCENQLLAKQAEITFDDENHVTVGTIQLDKSAIRSALDFFGTIQKRYQERPHRLKDPHQTTLISIGSELFDWLNQQASLSDIMDDMPTTPWLVEFCITGRPKTELEKAFLHLPWEILADQGQFLVADDYLQYSPVRRIGNIAQDQTPSEKRLAMMFMAASPSSSSAVLGYEQEENAILQACHHTRQHKMDFYVEESGSLNQLKEEVSLVNGVDIIHLSCHGTDQSPARLVLENDLGGEDFVEGRAVAQALRGTDARLLVLSACHSADSHNNLTDPMSSELLMSGMNAVIGMGGAVSDSDASGFTAKLYQNLAEGKSIEWSVADARCKALNPIEQHEVAYDWHLPRLLLRKNGGGCLAAGHQSRNPSLAQHGSKEAFGDKANPVASRYEFVGRRRHIQNILKVWRSGKHSALITGLGRQGKSSLALRLAYRLSNYQLVVVYQDYQPLRILEAIKSSYNTPVVREIIEPYEALIKSTPSNASLFAECIAAIINNESGLAPLLLVIDDLECVLENHGSAHQALHLIEDVTIRHTLAGLVRVFHEYQGHAKLLFTSRYEFQLTDSSGKDWARVLHHEPLPPMSDVESRKQFQLKQLKQSNHTRAALQGALDIAESKLWSLLERIRQYAKGSPGLQDFMFNLLYEKPAEVESVLAQLEHYHQTGSAPDDQALNNYFQNLALESLLALLTPAQTQLLSALTLFDIPIPQTAFAALIETCSVTVTDGERLLALGLCDSYPDADHHAVMIHPLLRPKVEPLSDESVQFIGAGVLPLLWKSWQTAYSPVQALQLLDLALTQSNTEIVAACCEDALYYLNETLQQSGAAQQRAIAVMQLADTQNMSFEIYALRWLGEVLSSAPHQARWVKHCYERALQQAALEDENFESGSLRFSYAKWLKQQGDSGSALVQLELAKEEFLSKKDERNIAVVLGDIARIRVSKGEVDSALSLHEERLAVFESLGDQRERAVTLGDIARIRVSKGEVDSALALQEERLSVARKMEDLDSVGAAQWDIAQIDLAQARYVEARERLAEAWQIFSAIGRVDFLAAVGHLLGQLLIAFELPDQAKPILLVTQQAMLKMGEVERANQVQKMLDACDD